jgi:hypothetical protein
LHVFTAQGVRAAAGVGSAEQEAWSYTDATAEPEAPTGKAVNTMERICLHLAWCDACTAWEIGNGQAPKEWATSFAPLYITKILKFPNQKTQNE